MGRGQPPAPAWLCIRRYQIICLGLIFGRYAPESLTGHVAHPGASERPNSQLPTVPRTGRSPSGSRGAPAGARQSPPPSCPTPPPHRASVWGPPAACRPGWPPARGVRAIRLLRGVGRRRGARHLMQPGVQVRKRAPKGAAARLLTAAPRNREPLSFHEIQPDSGLVKGRGGDSAGSCSGQRKFDLRKGQQLVASFASVGAARALVGGHRRHLELGPETYCRVWFGRPARGRWTEDGRR